MKLYDHSVGPIILGLVAYLVYQSLVAQPKIQTQLTPDRNAPETYRVGHWTYLK